MKRIVILCAGFIAFESSFASPANAGPNEWIKLSQFKKEVASLKANGKMFKRLVCGRDKSNGIAMAYQHVIRVRSSTKWEWAVGRSVTAKGAKYRSRGYRQISLHTNTGGNRIQCAIWKK